MLKLTSKTFSSRVTLLKHLFSIVSYDKKKALIVAFFEYCKVSLTTPSAYYLRPHIQCSAGHSALCSVAQEKLAKVQSNVVGGAQFA